ncbi:MAG: hypothetical protein ABI580_10570 [Burkholderiaceae bacterium]
MKNLLTVAALVSLVSGCAIVPVGPPGGAYFAPRVVVPVPAVVVRPWYYRRWHGY